MKNKIKVLIIISISIILVLVGIILFLQKQDNKKIEEQEDLVFDDIQEDITGSKEVKSKDDFYIASSCVDTYLSYIASENTEAVYDVLDTVYKKQYNITKDNVKQYIDSFETFQVFKATKMQATKGKDGLLTFYIEGTVRQEDELQRKPEQEFKVIVRMNTQEKAFSILPYSYVKNQKIEDVSQIKEEYISNEDITLNDNNEYLTISIDDKIMANLYFTDYKENMQYNVEKAYNNLEQTYRQKRFENLEGYKSYLNQIKAEINDLTLAQYMVNEKENSTEYVCKDKYGNLYIFDTTAIMQYTLMLDTYTIEQTKFTQEYEKSNAQKRVMLNIDKFIQMINAKDYTNSYALLSQGFKEKYFKTQADYEKYMKQKMFAYNEVTYQGFQKFNEAYAYTTTLKDKTGKNSTTKEFNVTMKLKEGTNFELSFEV